MFPQPLLRNVRLTAIFLGIILLVIFLSSMYEHSTRVAPPRYYQSKHQLCRDFTAVLNDYRACLLSKLRPHEDAFGQLRAAVEQCVDMKLWSTFELNDFHNGDEPKLAILAKPDQPCVGVTLGVGRNIKAEQQIKETVPQCQLYGADPIFTSGKLFREVGQYFEIAVGANHGVQIQNVLEDGGYHEKKVMTVDLPEFLAKYVKTATVDFLLMDNEGQEYEIIPKFLLDSPTVRICQMNVEMHGPLAMYNMNTSKFNVLIESVLTRSQFLPFYSTTGWGHLQTFYVNVEDKYCVDKYFKYRYCDQE